MAAHPSGVPNPSFLTPPPHGVLPMTDASTPKPLLANSSQISHLFSPSVSSSSAWISASRVSKKRRVAWLELHRRERQQHRQRVAVDRDEWRRRRFRGARRCPSCSAPSAPRGLWTPRACARTCFARSHSLRFEGGKRLSLNPCFSMRRWLTMNIISAQTLANRVYAPVARLVERLVRRRVDGLVL